MTLIQRMAQLESRLSRIGSKLGLSSCKLLFPSFTWVIQVDPETGCEYQEKSNYPIELTAFLEQSKSQTRTLEDKEVPGQNASSILMEGYLIDPVFLPTAVRPGMVADISLGNPDESFEDGFYPMVGKFTLLPSIQASNTIANHDIKGWVQFAPGGYAQKLSDAYGQSGYSPTFPPLYQYDSTFDSLLL